MNNVKRAINLGCNPDWRYFWKLTTEADVTRVVDLPCPHIYENQWVRIEPDGPTRTKITRKAGYSWDGCSVVPDAPGTKDASGVHDPVYQFSEEIASAWNMSVNEVLRWGDKAFLQVMRQDKCPVAYLYYMGVRLFGGAFRWISKGLS